MKTFAASFEAIMIRFTAMMMVVIIGVLLQQWWLAFLGLPLFLSAITAVSFQKEATPKVAKPTAKIVSINKKNRRQRKMAS